jgi:PhnB protein
MVKAIPDGYNTVTPYLVVKSPETLIAFAKEVFDATEHDINKTPDGKITHAEIQVGDSKIMIGRECEKNKGMSSMLYIYVKNVDAVYSKALKVGAEKIEPVKDQFYGDRSGGVQDSNGIKWYIATHVEDVSKEEMSKRMQVVMAK